MSLPAVYLPSARDLATAARDTHLLLKLRWRMVRGTRPRAAVWLGLGGLLVALFAASNIGVMIRQFAEQGVDTAAGQFAVNYVIALDRGDLGVVGAAALGSALAAALFSPFTGSANLALAAANDLTGLRPSRIHRYFDSLVTAGVSTIGFLQLLTLTTVASLLTLDGGRTGGLLFTWAVWPTLLLASVAEGWLIELVHRSYGPRVRRGIGLGLLALVAAVVGLDPHHGRTLFGVGSLFAQTLESAGEGNFGRIAWALLVIAGLSTVLAGTGLVACRAALSKPAGVDPVTRARRWRIPLSSHPRLVLLQILAAQTVRTMEIRRPLATILVIGVPAVWLSGAADTTMTTLVIAIPLAVALAWGINTFGVLGPGMTWLAAQPHLMRALLPLIVATQLGVTMLLSAAVWLPPTLFGRIPAADIAALAAGTTVSMLFTSRSAAAKTVHKPHLTALGTRGDVIVPPLTAINYTLRFALWSGQLGVLVMSEHDRWLQLLLVIVAVCWTSMRFVRLLRQWRNRELQARVVAQVAAA